MHIVSLAVNNRNNSREYHIQFSFFFFKSLRTKSSIDLEFLKKSFQKRAVFIEFNYKPCVYYRRDGALTTMLDFATTALYIMEFVSVPFIVGSHIPHGGSEEQIILEKLLKNYDQRIRPPPTNGSGFSISIYFFIIFLKGLKMQNLKTKTFLLKWFRLNGDWYRTESLKKTANYVFFCWLRYFLYTVLIHVHPAKHIHTFMLPAKLKKRMATFWTDHLQ